MARRYATFVVATYLLSFTSRHVAFGQCEVHEDAKLTASDAAGHDNFGLAVCVSGDVAVVGAYLDDCAAGINCGSAYVYRFNGSNWVEEQKLTASDAAANDQFGASVSVSGDVAVVGAYLDDCAVGGHDCGSAYVYRFNGSNWVEEQKLTSPDTAAFDDFGVSVSLSGDVAVVGGFSDDCVGQWTNCGTAYVYRFNGSSWVLETKLRASDGVPNDNFRASVSVSADVVVVGASGDDCGDGFSCGSAYVFRFNPGPPAHWVQQAKLRASDGMQDDFFGASVSVSGNVAVVGAASNDCGVGGPDCGSAYVYRFNGSNWVQEQKLTASDAAANDYFGSFVSISLDVALVGSGSDRSGLAYVYRFNGGTWVEAGRLTTSDAAAGGRTVSVSGNVGLMGAPGDDCADGTGCGSVYVYATLPSDCNANGIPDECDIASGTSMDANGNGIPDECEVLPPGNIVWDANDLSADRTTRSLRFRVEGKTDPSLEDAIRVTMVDLQNPQPPNAGCCPPQDFHTYESATCTAAGETGGCARWVGKPGTFYEAQGPPLSGPYRAARLQCTPFYFDWVSETATTPITVVGAEILPSSEYRVQAYGSSCVGNEGTCTNVSTPVQMLTRRSADVALVYNPPGTTTQPDAIDVTQLVNKFKNVPGAPIKPIAQLQPNLPELNADINALDIVAVVDALKGSAYPFSGPCPCPSTVMCNTVECPSGPAACVTAFGAGAMCVKTCDTGDNAGEPCINNGHCPGGGTCGNVFCRDRCGRCTP